MLTKHEAERIAEVLESIAWGKVEINKENGKVVLIRKTETIKL